MLVCLSCCIIVSEPFHVLNHLPLSTCFLLTFSSALSPALSPGSDSGLGAVSPSSGESVMIGTAISCDITHTCVSSDVVLITG